MSYDLCEYNNSHHGMLRQSHALWLAINQATNAKPVSNETQEFHGISNRRYCQSRHSEGQICWQTHGPNNDSTKTLFRFERLRHASEVFKANPSKRRIWISKTN